MPIKAGGGVKRNASVKQGMQVSMATQRAATTTRHRRTDKLSGDTYQPVYLPWPVKREGRGGEGQTAAQMHKYTNTSSKLHDLQSEYASSNAKQRPVCWIGAHDLQTPLTSIGSILT